MPRGEVSPLAEGIAESPIVRDGLLADIDTGLREGGESWYELGPVKASFDEMGDPEGFQRWINAGGSASIQNPVPNEISLASILLFAQKRGLSFDEALAEMQRQIPGAPRPLANKANLEHFLRAEGQGRHIPRSPSTADRKVPWYSQNKEGGSLESMAALDTWERRALLEAAKKDPKLAKLAGEAEKAGLAEHMASMEQLRVRQGRSGRTRSYTPRTPEVAIPMRNALDYEALSKPYQVLAKELGLPSTGVAQAGRWIGGMGRHNMKSPPGDYVQLLEDAIYSSAANRGLDTGPKALRDYWKRVAQGQDFLLPPSGSIIKPF
jgi:hypothetical protein